jgi:hypothetical protein
MNQFNLYNDIVFDAFNLHTKQKEIIERKQEIIEKILEFYNYSCSSILFIGFNPAILSWKAKEIFVAEASNKVKTYLTEHDIKFSEFDPAVNRKYDVIVALDEYLTFADSDIGQKNKIDSLCRYAENLIVTTVKDYKNQDFKEREYSQPAIIRNNNMLTAFTEIHDWDIKDKNVWQTAVYQLSGMESQCKGVFARRSLFFKQLAKFSIDNGATDFLVHKNLMYKSLIKKNYEHVISICFEH